MPNAIVLFSGGIDSTTTLAIARSRGFDPIALSFDYGQRHVLELQKARLVLDQFKTIRHLILSVPLDEIGGSALTAGIPVPKDRHIDQSIPTTYVPARNLIFLSLAAAVGEVNSAYDLFYGANVLDYSGYPDCRPEFIRALEETINLGTKAGVQANRFRIHAPLLQMSKAEIIRKGYELKVDYTHTHSCYDPTADGLACGLCDSCQLRLKGFKEAGYQDPAKYVRKPS